MSILSVRNLCVNNIKNQSELVKNLNFSLDTNKCLAIVGESGSGKSISVKAMIGLLPINLKVTGEVLIDNKNIIDMGQNELRRIRGKEICMIPQDAMSAFDPLYTIGSQIIETLTENLGISKIEAEKKARESLKNMNIYEAEQVMKKYPHQLSGGMLQRCMISIAMALNPKIIIADEPTTALDSINQRDVVDEFIRLRQEFGTAIIFISHDLGIVQHIADTVLVMKNGHVVEQGESEEVLKRPKHEYTKYLIKTRLELTESFCEFMKGEDSDVVTN